MRSLIKFAFAALLTLPVYQSARAASWSGSITSGEEIDLIYTGTLPAEVTATFSAIGGSPLGNFGCQVSGCLTSPAASWSANATITDGQGNPFLDDIGPAPRYESFSSAQLADSSCDDPDSCLGTEFNTQTYADFKGTLNDPTILISDFTSGGFCFVFEGSACDGFSTPTGMDIRIDIAGNGELQMTTTPLPATLPLFATGLGALGLLGWCNRKRKTSGAAALGLHGGFC